MLDAKDDFLEWDEMTRMPAQRSIVAWDIATGALATLMPEALIGQWTLARDGSAITVQEDISKKSDYDTGGREYNLVTQSRSGTARTLFPTLKGIQLQWSEDGVHYM